MPQTHVPRATRYPLNLPVRFRPDGEDRWSFGMSVNISHTGILFEASGDLDARKQLQLEVVLPGDSEGAARIVTNGVVSRTRPGSAGGGCVMAVSLLDSDIVRVPA